MPGPAGQDRARHLDAPAPHRRLTPARIHGGSPRCPTGRQMHGHGPRCPRRAARRLRLGRRERREEPAAERPPGRSPSRAWRTSSSSPALRRRQVDGDERLRGRRLLLRRQPAAGDDPRAGRAVRPRGLEGRARGGRLRRARRRLLRSAARRARRPRGARRCATACCSSTPTTRRSSPATRRPAAATRSRPARASSAASPPSARCSSRSRAWPTS